MPRTIVAKSDTSVLDLRSALARLRGATPGQYMLSIYLDTSPERIVRQAFLLAYRDGIRSVRATLSRKAVGQFEAAAMRAEQYLTEEFVPHARGLALFVDAGLQNVIAVRLPKPPIPEQVVWQPSAEVGPLEAILDDNERIAVVLFDTQRARVLTVFLGVIEDEQELEDYVPGKQATGGWFGLQQTNFERHREDHLRRHAERTARVLMDVLRTRPFDRLLLAGPEEPLAVLRRELPRPLRARLTGTLDLEFVASDREVLDAALAAVDSLLRPEQLRL